jgi:uncharacterized membrane protein
MPFCTQCGNTVDNTATFCARCGARQPGAPAAPPPPPLRSGEDWLNGITPSTAATLCYVPFFGWVAAIVFLASYRFRTDNLVRFHAFQGLYLGVVWLLIDMAIGSFMGWSGIAARRAITGSLKLSVLCGWGYMLFKTSQGELVRLPFLSELADRSVAEHATPRG